MSTFILHKNFNREEETIMKKIKKIFVNLILFGIIFALIICIIIEKSEENNKYQIVKKQETLTVNTEDTEKIEYPKEEIPQTYKGYKVCAKLEIPEIELETYILNNYSLEALQISVTKFWGVEPNTNGNFCVVGHNYINKNMFKNLKKLEIGDKLNLIDSEIGKVQYEVFEKYTVLPEDVSCLDSITNNKKEITLITCTNDSKKRLIIKAKEIQL